MSAPGNFNGASGPAVEASAAASALTERQAQTSNTADDRGRRNDGFAALLAGTHSDPRRHGRSGQPHTPASAHHAEQRHPTKERSASSSIRAANATPAAPSAVAAAAAANAERAATTTADRDDDAAAASSATAKTYTRHGRPAAAAGSTSHPETARPTAAAAPQASAPSSDGARPAPATNVMATTARPMLSGEGDGPPRPAAPPAPPHAAALAEHVERDPSLTARLSGRDARVSLLTPEGELGVFVRVNEQEAHVTLSGIAAPTLGGRVAELHASLAAQGLALASVALEAATATAAATAANAAATAAAANTDSGAAAADADAKDGDTNDRDADEHPRPSSGAARGFHVTA